MKKITTLLTVVALATLIGLAGCKKDKKAADTAAPKTEEPKGDTPKTDTPPTTDTPPKTDTPPATGGATGLAECDAYMALVEKYMSCDKVPQAARDGAKQGIDAMKAGWANVGAMPDDQKKMANDGCKTGADALKQSATAMGCAL